ncbi:MAG: copper amine oxidase N-terminal domain-containing protein [Clostridia bacterium]|nr:copper amine oxidase N-terminal domain-containing protein [Clostridia bacterium]
MKKLLISVMLTLMIVAVSSVVTFADSAVIECPNVKIMIDGKVSTYKDVPIKQNDRTLLPLREVLVNLGVPNDDQHIIWNDAEKSVTVHKDSTEIYLKTGGSVAYVNNKEVPLDVAPVNYAKNGRTYIPARFIAEALGKKVSWDGSTSTVLIRDTKEFEDVKAVFEKVTQAGKSITKMKSNMDAKIAVSADILSMNINVNSVIELDKSKKLMHATSKTNMLGQDFDSEYYYANNAMYMKSFLSEDWEKESLPEDLSVSIFENNINASFKGSEAVYAGLVMDSSKADKIVLKGNVFVQDLLNTGAIGNEDLNDLLENADFGKYYLEITVNKANYQIESISIDITMTVEEKGVKQATTLQATNKFDYSTNFEITLPKEIQ